MTDDVTDNIVVRGCLVSIPGWVLKKVKNHISYTFIIYLICNKYSIYLICLVYIYIYCIYM